MTELERRLAALEGEHARKTAPGRVPAGGEELWALARIQEETAARPDGNGLVVFAGSVRLPTHEQYEWEQHHTTDGLIEEDWNDAAEAFAALGSAVRLRLLREIIGGRRTAAELTALEGVGTTGQIYHHLRQLSSAGWLHTPGRGRYEVPPGRVVPLLAALAAARR
ncbi:ArsR/SmtB family transcription factor [Streptomyces sp. Da 82-17]|uniref:ArsR/SmtB family transcription factor n=1 Tax=Streptomyces sp. Da 82-17 TaxID=3377116 RepID=UPI0038D4DEBD